MKVTAETTQTSTQPDRTDQAKHFRITGDNQTSILELLARASSLTKSTVKTAAQKGAIWLSKHAIDSDKKPIKTDTKKPVKAHKPERIRRLKRPLKTHEQVDFYYNPKVLDSITPNAICLLDATDYSVWLKPRGMFSQGSKWGDFSALYRWVELYFQDLGKPRKSWIVHRLDRATQGLMILAHSKQMARYFSQQFEQGKIHKIYQANVQGDFLKTIEALKKQPAGDFQIIYKNQSEQISHILVTHKIDGKDALSEISMSYYCQKNDFSRLKITLHTGRKHQIRKHLAYLNCPVLGDRLYGEELISERKKENHEQENRPDLQLTAYSLRWTCPLDQKEKNLELKEDKLDLLQCQTKTPIKV